MTLSPKVTSIAVYGGGSGEGVANLSWSVAAFEVADKPATLVEGLRPFISGSMIIR
jgi:hypothetical protein